MIYLRNGLVVALFVVAMPFAVIGLFCLVDHTAKANHKIVHSSEKDIALYITALGGSYQSDRDPKRHITSVSFRNTGITSKDLSVILRLKKLMHLSLVNTQVGDSSLQDIAACKNIKTLETGGSRITRAGIIRLYEDCPSCMLSIDDTPDAH